MDEQLIKDFKELDEHFGKKILECYEKHLEDPDKDEDDRYDGKFLQAAGTYVTEILNGIPKNRALQWIDHFEENNKELKGFLCRSVCALRYRDEKFEKWKKDNSSVPLTPFEGIGFAIMSAVNYKSPFEIKDGTLFPLPNENDIP